MPNDPRSRRPRLRRPRVARDRRRRPWPDRRAASPGRPARRVSVLARGAFAVLVAVTFVGFFVVNRLKHSPSIVQRVMMTTSFSPTVGSATPLERLSFRIKQTDDVTSTIVDSHGDAVATLTHNYRLRRYTQLELGWNGRPASGA